MEILQVNKARTREELETVFAIRNQIFAGEQGSPAAMESSDDNDAVHYIALMDNNPCGACRWRKTEDGYKLEQFAVLPEFRNKRVGQALLAAALADIPQNSELIYLNAQADAVGLYARFGFAIEGDLFEEDGIQQYRMVKV